MAVYKERYCLRQKADIDLQNKMSILKLHRRLGVLGHSHSQWPWRDLGKEQHTPVLRWYFLLIAAQTRIEGKYDER